MRLKVKIDLLKSKVKPQLNQPAHMQKKDKLPGLVDLNRGKKDHYKYAMSEEAKNRVKNVANAPYGIQNEVIMSDISGPFAGNGVNGHYTHPLQKLIFQYCDKGGSSSGMREFILKQLPKWAEKNPYVEVIVQPKQYHHPHIKATYDNGHTKTVCVRNESKNEIFDRTKLYADSCGMPLLKPKKPVYSVNESIRGIWTPFKEPKLRVSMQPQGPKQLYGNE